MRRLRFFVKIYNLKFKFAMVLQQDAFNFDGTNNRARIKITAERIALYYDRGLAFWNTFTLRINTSLLRISQFTELKYSTNQ